MAEPILMLTDIWYFACLSNGLRPGKTCAVTLLGEPILLGRTEAGDVFAMRDLCPHRGMPLSCGRFDGQEVECPYHGWRFDQRGVCTAIPSLVDAQDFDIARIKVRPFPVREVNGNIWVWMGKRAPDREPPQVPHFANDRRSNLSVVMRLPCDIDQAALGLLDPAHGPYVHSSWFWRSQRSIHEKCKAFAPTATGFAMVRHRPSSNSFAYKLLGGTPNTEIEFQLPGVRIEHIEIGRHHVVNFTTVTPIDDHTTEITNQLYWSQGWVALFKPILWVFARTFLNQDRVAMQKLSGGLRHDPSTMLIPEADIQGRWYYRLKAAWARYRDGGEDAVFENPVKAATLRWRT